MAYLQTFKRNKEGRDFVVGDIHGCRDRLDAVLNHVDFNFETDRLFSVGDLIDRGSQNFECLELLFEPWFHCVLANHEQMMLEAYTGSRLGMYWVQNGGVWGAEAMSKLLQRRLNPTEDSSPELDLLSRSLNKIKELPYLINLEIGDGEYIHIVHAEIPTDRPISTTDLFDENLIKQLATVQTYDGDYFCWGRYLFADFYGKDLSNLEKMKRVAKFSFHSGTEQPKGLIVSGHTIVQAPLMINNRLNIDTGAYKSYPNAYGSTSNWAGLTLFEVGTSALYQAQHAGVRTIDPVVINTFEEQKDL
jgi:hypothetical protein